MKKVVFITPNLANGGAERVTCVLANALAQKGNQIIIAYMKDDITSYDSDMNVEIRKLYPQKGKISRIIAKIINLRKMMKDMPDAAFVAMLPYETLYTFVASIGLKNRIVYSLRNDPTHMNSKLDIFIKRVIYPRARRIVFQTEDAKNYFSEKIRKKGIVIPNPIKEDLPERYEGIREKEIVSVGRLTPQKNYPMLLKAFRKVHSRHPDWILKIYGQGELQKELVDLSKKLGIAESVEFCGFENNIINAIYKSGIFAMSSDFEGISNAMLEALSIGVPTICTDCPIGGARMMIDDHQTGLLIPVGDVEKMADMINKLIENQELSEKLSVSSVEIRERLSVDKISERWRRIL